MKKQVLILFALTIIFLFTSCEINGECNSETMETLSNSQTEEVSALTSSEKKLNEDSISKALPKTEQLLAGMTLKEKIGQLFIVRPDAFKTSFTPEQINNAKNFGATSFDGQMKEMLKKYPAGGVVLFSKNISMPAQVTKLIADMQQNSKIPLFVCVDEEGGSVARIANSKGFDVPKFSDMQEVGQSADPHKAYEVGLTIGTYLTQYGFNIDFAPVADINTNPDNVVIGKRSFGSDPYLAASMVAEEIEGFHEAGIMTSVKHFPGHGDTKGDTHDGFVSVEKTWPELLSGELIPFQEAINSSVDMVMISHITTPNITTDNLPSSLSYEMVTGKLRSELKFNGIVITDSMSMGAITNVYSPQESAVKAILAGVDIILMPEDYAAAYEGVFNAVKSGILSEERINESVLRILTLKEQYEK